MTTEHEVGVAEVTEFYKGCSQNADASSQKLECKITVDYKPGRWGKVAHIFDPDGNEIKLGQKDAVRVARQILKIMAKER